MKNSIKLHFSKSNLRSLLQWIGATASLERAKMSARLVRWEAETASTQRCTPNELREPVLTWWKNRGKYLTITSNTHSGVFIRLYRSQFKVEGASTRLKDEDNWGTFYLRYRETITQKLQTEKFGKLTSDNLHELLKAANHIKSQNSIGVQLVKEAKRKTSQDCKMTLKEFLYTDYLEVKTYENPKTATHKMKVIERHFKYLLEKPISQINAEAVRAWMKSKERTLTQKQLAAGESLWVVQPSTMKEVICTLRACIQLAKEKGHILKHDLYDLPRIRVDNEVIRYLTEEEEIRLYAALNERNAKKLEQRQRTILHRKKRGLQEPVQLENCAFADHLLPLVVLFKETGIRPGTLMNSRRRDVDLEAGFIRVRSSRDKRRKGTFIPLSKLALETLREWFKHHVHALCQSHHTSSLEAWLFPSPVAPANQLTTIDSAWKRIIKKLELKILDFTIYGMILPQRS